MEMYEMERPRTLFPLDLQWYFNWPPPPLPPQSKITPRLITASVLLAPCLLFFLLIGIEQLVSNPTGAIIVLAIIALGIWLLINHVRKGQQRPLPPPVPTDEEYEAWVKSWRDSIRQYGLQKLGLYEWDEIKVDRPLYIRNIVWPNSADADYYRSQGSPVLVKYGWDGRPHGSVNRFTFFYPTEHSIAVFEGDVNALGPMRFERTRTYFYQDIVGVETFNINDGQTSYVMQQFDLRVSSGQSISARTHVPDLNVEETVQALRTLLKEKKQSRQVGSHTL